MRQTIQHDANAALRPANLKCEYLVVQVLDATRLSIETARYDDAERVLADAGLVLVDADDGGFMTFARIVRAGL